MVGVAVIIADEVVLVVEVFELFAVVECVEDYFSVFRGDVVP